MNQNIESYFNAVEKVSIERGKVFAEQYTATSYAYAFGFAISNFKYCLDALNLTEEQIAILNERTEWVKEKGLE